MDSWKTPAHGVIASFNFTQIGAGQSVPAVQTVGSATQAIAEGSSASRRLQPSPFQLRDEELDDEGTEESNPLIQRKRRGDPTKQQPQQKKKKRVTRPTVQPKTMQLISEDVDSAARLLASPPHPLGGETTSGVGIAPRALGDLTGEECRSQMIAQIAPADLQVRESLSRQQMADDLVLTIETARVECLALARSLLRAEGEVQAKDKEFLAALARCTHAEEESCRLREENERLKAERLSVDTELARVWGELARVNQEKGKELAAVTQDCSEKLAALKKEIVAKENLAFQRGTQQYRLRYFLSSEGHAFLRIMLLETITAFVRTPELLNAAAPALQWLVKESTQITLNLIQASPEQRALCENEAVLNAIDSGTLGGILGINVDSRPTPEWWFPVIDKAISMFVTGRGADLSVEPFIRTPYLDEIRSRIRSVRGNYPGGGVFYEPALVVVTAPTSPAHESAQREPSCGDGSGDTDEEMQMENPPTPTPNP
ncbi:uncharacterized protein LOC130996698 [Salvia miltiorrhiza]|uniref:uncharacterized protein LOC130996698 n=1 Tax=Salvia miltiorrhiza TaxID=226208 RepID=UPI0025AB8AE6|nr:uncharacterized protein LOC130996698 [Salvia miltiorrhiza]XP_057777978.1 uncharacterized protein LOC130996698 [Salvia miltiorrhiza]XP_057777979.1 uncharacterized protein LOC130996698 [Salvia miltiorrhiza]XP_057777981.1 uncharacterized protein LOC130996698 [Salvia miltiorrhiza]